MALEIGLIAGSGAAWAAQRKAEGQAAWPALACLTLLTAVQILSSSLGGSGGSPDPLATRSMALGAYLLITLAAVLLERGRPIRA